MNTARDYTTSFDVPVTPREAFDAAAHPERWWNRMIDGEAGGVGDVFVFDVPGLHHSAFEVIEADAGRRLRWRAIPSGSSAEAEEWLGTVLVFDFAGTPEGTRVTFTHHGLVPQLECHGVCTVAWDYHLDAGLRALLADGRGAPLTVDTYLEVARRIGAQPAG